MNKEEQAFHYLLDEYMQIPEQWEDYQIIKNAIKKNKQSQNNWNELKKKLERRINSYEERKKLGKGYELTEVMEISLACDKRFLKEIQELEGNNDM